MIEAVDHGCVRLRKVAGTLNPTNSLTKHTPFKEHTRDVAFFMSRLRDVYPDGPHATTIEVDEALQTIRTYAADS